MPELALSFTLNLAAFLDGDAETHVKGRLVPRERGAADGHLKPPAT